MGLEILKGKKVNEIKAEQPENINILLNNKSAEDLNIKFPNDILESAYRVYTDKNNNYIGKK